MSRANNWWSSGFISSSAGRSIYQTSFRSILQLSFQLITILINNLTQVTLFNRYCLKPPASETPIPTTRHKQLSNLTMAYYQQTCDSYFVDSHEDRERRFRDEVREHERVAKRQTQLTIAEELSQLASHEYQADILQHMENMEVNRLAARNQCNLC